MQLIAAWSGLLILLLSTGAAAQITINPAVVVFESAQPQTIVVSNRVDEITFVTVRPRIVTAPGADDEKLKALPNPGDVGLLVTPLRMALESGERRAVNLTTLKPPGDSDRVWRVQIAPAVGQLKPGQSGVSFVVAYDALVIQRARNPHIDVHGIRAADKLTLTNAGNSFAMVASVQQCRTARDCVKIGSKRLYAGQMWTASLPLIAGTVAVEVEGPGGKRETLKF